MLNWIKKSIVLIILCAACLTGSVALAAEAKIKIPDLQVKIPGLENSFSTDNRGDWIGIYIAGIYKYAVGIIGILAAVILMVAGLMWLTAGGNTSQVQSAQEWIKAALTGMILALTSYVILFTINPDLVKFRSLNIQTVKQTPTTTEGTSSSARELS